jgi:polyhydroxyalkanoate synthase subunit PhaC
MWLGETPLSRALRHGFQRTDHLRRGYGVVFDALGFGPIRTPSRILREEAGLRLHVFGDPAASPAMLIVPAPIKRGYIWDLEPEVSVVRRCLEHGLRVYLAEWRDEGAASSFGLDRYADRLLLASIDAIADETGQQCVVMAGHSLGGTLAAIFAALHPHRVRALVLLEAPTRFGAAAGAFAPLVALVAASPIRDLFGAVPGSFLDVASAAASPSSFIGARWLDAIAVAGSGPALLTHLRVERWTYDEFALPGRLFEEVVEVLYREDRFIAGTLTVGGREATPHALDMPVLSVFRPKSLVVPPATILPLHGAATHPRKRLIRYDGEHGVALQHVGILVGRQAHRRVWPEILGWIDGRGA